MATVPSQCPKCGALLAVSGRQHCDIKTRHRPCGWITCSVCRTTVDTRTGAHTPRSAS